jgi:Uncharacterized conserved protein
MTESGGLRRAIAVPGTGRVTVEPDVASIHLGVTVIRQTASAARESAAMTMTAILDALAAAGIARRDMRTALVALNPVTDYSSDKGPQVTGYQISNSVAITVRDLAATGTVIDAALGAGASSMDGLEFHLEDTSEAESAARTAAVEDARRRATTIAAAAKVTLGSVIDVVEGDRGQGPMPFAGGMRVMAMKAEAADTPVESGTQEISVSVVVTFAIG